MGCTDAVLGFRVRCETTSQGKKRHTLNPNLRSELSKLQKLWGMLRQIRAESPAGGSTGPMIAFGQWGNVPIWHDAGAALTIGIGFAVYAVSL